MTEYPQLSRPPLREAVVSLQFAEELPESLVLSLKGKELAGYQIVQPIKRGQFKFEMNIAAPAQATITKDELDGWRYGSEDGSKVVQLRRIGMTCSVLRGYTNWPEFKAASLLVWEQFRKWTGRCSVGSLAVRYINVIQVPLGADFDEYLAAGPRVPRFSPDGPQLLNGFFHRVEIPFAKAEAIAIVTQALEPPNQLGIPVVLDIDVQSARKYEADSSDIWLHMDTLREIKNLIFFSSLTNRALETLR